MEEELLFAISEQEYTYETNTYPQNPIIQYKNPNRNLTYKIIAEGKYPPDNKLVLTKKPFQYKIPDKYIVETTYNKKIFKKQLLVQLIIIKVNQFFELNLIIIL